jgi:hypothetical protein
VEVSVRTPLGTSTRDYSTWDGEVLRGKTLADWDADPRVIRFVEELAAGIEPDQPVAYRYAAAISGEPRRLRRPEYGLWKRRLLIHSGLVQPPDVALAVLPGGAGDQARQLWPSIALVIQARVLGGTPADDPLPLTRRFLRRWVPMGEGSVRTAMEELEALDYLIRAGIYRPKGGLPTILWQVRAGEAAVSLTLELPPAGETRGHGG